MTVSVSSNTFGVTVSFTSLSTLANTLSSGGNADYSGGYGSGTAAGFDWQTECHYYAAEREIYYFLKAANNNTSWELWRFEEDTETLTSLTNESGGPGSWSAPGHVYGNSTIDLDTGDLYIQLWGDNFIRKRTRATGAWSQSSESANDFSTSPPIDGISHHPDFYGFGDGAVVVLGRSNTPPYLYAWRTGTDAWERHVRTTGSASKEGGGTYNPYDGYVYIGGSGGKPIYRCSDNGDATARAVPPINFQGGGASGDHGTLIVHPDGSGDMLLIENADSSQGSRVWKTTDGCATFTAQSAHPFSGFSGPHYVNPGYGIIGKIGFNSHRIWKP